MFFMRSLIMRRIFLHENENGCVLTHLKQCWFGKRRHTAGDRCKKAFSEGVKELFCTSVCVLCKTLFCENVSEKRRLLAEDEDETFDL